MEFTNEEKTALFDKIAALYFNKNFRYYPVSS